MANKPGILRRLFSNVFLLLNFLAIIWLLLCVAAGYVNPATVMYIALFSLTTPFAIAANIGFIIFWLFSSHKLRLLWSLAALACSYKIVMTIVGLNFSSVNDMSRKPANIKIMSWNAHGMGIFNVPQDKAFDNRILEFIKAENADILCLPEYSLSKENILKPFAAKIISDNNYIDYRFQPDNSLNNKVYLGTALFSKYPFKNYESHKLAEYIYMMQGDVELPGPRVIRVFFVHLTTFGLIRQ